MHRFITAEDLKRVLEWQRRNPHFMVGEAMVALGLVNHDQLEELIELQAKLRADVRPGDVAKMLGYVAESTSRSSKLDALRETALRLFRR